MTPIFLKIRKDLLKEDTLKQLDRSTNTVLMLVKIATSPHLLNWSDIMMKQKHHG